MIPPFRSELDGFLKFMAQVDRQYIAGSSIAEICRKYELSPEQFSLLMNRFAIHPRGTEALSECELFAAVIPIFWAGNATEQAQQIGSGVLLRLPYFTFLLTAAHV